MTAQSPPDAFYASAERRIWRFQLALGLLGTGAAWGINGPAGAAGFAVGAAVSGLNFLWLKQAVDAVTEKATGAETLPARRQRRRLVWKFLGRYALIGLAAYGILKYTPWSLAALLAGLFLFVAAILAEICWELIRGT